MPAYFGSQKLGEFYFGGNKIASAFFGSNLVYTAVQPAPAVSVWDGTYDYSWYNTTDTSFHLTTCAQFMAFAKLCNGSAGGFSQDQFGGKTIYLDASMIINENYSNYASWGSSPPTYSMPNTAINFNGTLDGQFHSITGAYYKNTANWGRARLFDLNGSPKLKDLIIENYFLQGDYTSVIQANASTITLQGVIFRNGIVSIANLKATEPCGPCIDIWEASSSTVHTVIMSNCGAYNIKFAGNYKASGSQRENWGTLISNSRFGTSFTNIHGVGQLTNCFVCSCSMEPGNTTTTYVKYYKITGTSTKTITSCFEYNVKARYGSSTPSTSTPTAQGTAASSESDLITRYNNANTLPQYTLNSDFTFRGN